MYQPIKRSTSIKFKQIGNGHVSYTSASALPYSWTLQTKIHGVSYLYRFNAQNAVDAHHKIKWFEWTISTNDNPEETYLFDARFSERGFYVKATDK